MILTIFTFGESSSHQGGTLVIFPETEMINSTVITLGFFPYFAREGKVSDPYFSSFFPVFLFSYPQGTKESPLDTDIASGGRKGGGKGGRGLMAAGPA